MSDPDDRDLDAVDRLVRAHLDREAARLDAADLHSRIRDSLRLAAPEGDSVPAAVAGRAVARWSPPLGWVAAAAAALFVLVLGDRYLKPASANAATLLRNVRVIHSRAVDRCYRVHYAPDPRYWDGKKVLDGPSDSVLWTRGDRFWADCTIGTIRLAIGREEDGTIWVSPSRSKGIRFSDETSHLPKEVAVLCDINSLTVPALMDDVLADFDLRAEGPSSPSGEATSLVWARLKPGRSHPLISTALLEIDGRGGVLLRLVLWTTREGRPNGTVTYTLFQAATQGDDQYRLGSHLDPGAAVEVHTFNKPAPGAGKGRNGEPR